GLRGEIDAVEFGNRERNRQPEGSHDCAAKLKGGAGEAADVRQAEGVRFIRGGHQDDVLHEENDETIKGDLDEPTEKASTDKMQRGEGDGGGKDDDGASAFEGIDKRTRQLGVESFAGRALELRGEDLGATGAAGADAATSDVCRLDAHVAVGHIAFLAPEAGGRLAMKLAIAFADYHRRRFRRDDLGGGRGFGRRGGRLVDGNRNARWGSGRWDGWRNGHGGGRCRGDANGLDGGEGRARGDAVGAIDHFDVAEA